MGSLVFQATLGGQVNLNGPNTASTFDIAVPATTGTMVTTGDSGTVTNTMLAASAYNTPGTIGSGTANTGAFTTLSASSTVSGTGFSTYLASPPAIGGTTAASGKFSALTNTGLTSGRVVYSTTGGLETDSANLLYSGTDLTVYGLTVGRGASAVSTNTAVGVSALQGITSGANNVAIGYQAGYTTQNGTVVAVGYRAAYSTTSGTSIAIGSNAVYTNSTQNDIIGIGPNALQLATGAGASIAIGTNASNNASAGTSNVVIGHTAGQSGTGSNAVMLGAYAGNAGFGNNCVFVGTSATAAATSDTNEIIVGTNGTTGKGSSTGFINPSSGGVYQGNNSTLWSVTSDQRLKKNIVDNNTGLDIIKQIQVRNFEYRLPEEVTDVSQEQAIKKQGIQLGVIAQELQAVLPECVKTESTGVMTVDADNLTWYLVNAVKELSAQVAQLKSQLNGN